MADPSTRASGENPDDKLTIVGIGASAGGLAALRSLFSRVPENSGVAYVVVVHLSPDRKSHLAEVLQPHVKMPVSQVSETTALSPNQVYVIPPGANLSAIDTHLRLSDLEEQRRERAPIDHFFRTLAATHDGESIGVILTGTGSDGTLGIKEIKAKGGLTIVQDPAESEYSGMPQSAISSGMVDLVLPLDRIPEAIQRFALTQPRVVVPTDGEDVEMKERWILERILAQVRTRTGRDFTRYKTSTIMRRIQRRMQMHNVVELADYLEYLRKEPKEVSALSDDFLITVTNFFRDAEVFEYLEETLIPRIFQGKSRNEDIRVWSVGCATGEEAFSLAILLLEARRHRDATNSLQVFASDLHERSLETAREGFYAGDIAVDVPAERLNQYFEKQDNGYRIRQEVRDLVVFTPHNILADPPFSKLDLISCRNVLIYLQRDVQRDVIELFHYALKPDGHLVLGSAETVEGFELFQVEDRGRAVYAKRNVPARELRLPVFPLIHPDAPGHYRAAVRPDRAPPYGRLHQRIVEQYAPPSILLGPDNKVVHLSEHAGRYLTPSGGEFSSNIFKLIRAELRAELGAALHTAPQHGQVSRTKPLPILIEGEERYVSISVRPASEPEHEGFSLVIFDEMDRPGVLHGGPHEKAGHEEGEDQDPVISELEAELELTKKRLRAIIEDYETSQEEMKASNEEMQSSNEELRSTLEELETSKEELQSMNEELLTVSQENRHKVEELSQLSSDLQNLLAATDIATLFLDRDLRILRFTPAVGKLFNVVATDRGRPVSDLTHKLKPYDLVNDARAVLADLIPIEREVQDEAGRWYLLRIRPYRTPTDRIEGIVLTFVDFTDRRKAEDDLRASEERYRTLFEAIDEGFAVIEVEFDENESPVDFTYLEVNPAFERQTGFTNAIGKRVSAIVPDLDQEWYQIFGEVARTGAPRRIEKFEPALGRWFDMYAFKIPGDGRAEVALLFSDSTAERTTREQLRQSEERYRLLVESAHEYAIFMMDRNGIIRTWNVGAARIFGYEEEEVIGQPASILFVEEDRKAGIPGKELATAAREGHANDDREHLRKDGTRFWATGIMTRISGADGSPRGVAKILRDNTERKEAETERAKLLRELEALNANLENRVQERTRQVRELASRLTLAEQSERHRISQILHDDLQQVLYGIQLKMTFIRKEAQKHAGDPIAEHAAEAHEWIRNAIATTRRLTVDLSPPILPGEGLADAIQWLQRQMHELHGLSVELKTGENFVVENQEVRMLLFQIIRELLFNVVKHAETDAATVTLERDDHHVAASVADEGKGVGKAVRNALKSPGEKIEGLGLMSIRERLDLFGGTMEVESSRRKGTRVTVRVPAEPTF